MAKPRRPYSRPQRPHGRKTVSIVDAYATSHSDAVASIPEEFLECRTLGHAWKHTNVTRDRVRRLFFQYFGCMRPCGTTKKVTIDRHGDFVGTPTYSYRSTYKFKAKGGPDARDRAGMRIRALESISETPDQS